MTPDVKQDALFEHYGNIQHFYDELLDIDGNPRPNWKTFFQSFSKLGNDEIINRHHPGTAVRATLSTRQHLSARVCGNDSVHGHLPSTVERPSRHRRGDSSQR